MKTFKGDAYQSNEQFLLEKKTKTKTKTKNKNNIWVLPNSNKFTLEAFISF